jgi:hypothetical protein
MLKKNDNYKGKVQAATNGKPDVDEFLRNYGVDTERFLPVGAKVIMADNKPDSIKIICVDQKKSNNDYDYFVTVLLDEVDEPMKVLQLFESVDATIIHSGYNLEDVVIHKNFTIDENRVSNREKMDD